MDTYLMDNLHKLAEAHFGRQSTYSPNIAIEVEKSARVRRETNRYTLEEAAFYVEQKVAARAKTILAKLIAATANGSLTMFEPEGSEKYNPVTVREWHEEANAKDLNDWLEKNEPSIGRIFPEIKTRSNMNRAFLQKCINDGISPDIEAIWLHIRSHAGENNFFFKTAGASSATTIYDKQVLKENLSRQLKRLLIKPKNK